MGSMRDLLPLETGIPVYRQVYTVGWCRMFNYQKLVYSAMGMGDSSSGSKKRVGYMAIPAELENLFQAHGTAYENIPYRFKGSVRSSLQSLGVRPEDVALAAILKDDKGLVMAIYPAIASLNIDALNRALNRRLMPLPNTEIKSRLHKCETGVCVPLAALYDIDAVIDRTLNSSENIYFPISKQAFIRIDGRAFIALQGKQWVEHDIIHRPQETAKDDNDEVVETDQRIQIRQQLKRADDLPAMPRIANEILTLSSNPYANVSDLASVIEQDPSLAAQLLRYANSPFYGYKNDVESIQDAISRVLGFDMVMDMALGIAIGKSFQNPPDGPIGLNAFWRHSIYCAVLTQRLGKALKPKLLPRPGMAYLCGLLHNFGLLLEGHVFPKEYARLNRLVNSRPDESLIELEEEVMSVNHMESGAWLMEAWEMPDEVIATIREHHNEHYDGSHSVYANLVLLANRLLKTMLIGDEVREDLPEEVLHRLELEQDVVMDVFQAMIDNRVGLDFMALQMAA
jgi:HD-like signal output (HDOD) protein/prolyl-tRNA editing enzyme YbaK/EbsC (Cys-tRNA(Pro) deacylase)